MNIDKLKKAETDFLIRYPQGFESPEMKEIGKKHKMDKLIAFAQEKFAPDELEDIETSAENMIKMVQRSSMVSVFEKPKFRDAVRSMTLDDKEHLVDSLYELLHGDEAAGFHKMLDILTRYKLAKWTLITVYRCYYYPDTDFLYKPTTVKNIIKNFEIEDLVYRPRPSYDFFYRYRDVINNMKSMVDESIAVNGAAFSGFLMISMEIGQGAN